MAPICSSDFSYGRRCRLQHYFNQQNIEDDNRAQLKRSKIQHTMHKASHLCFIIITWRKRGDIIGELYIAILILIAKCNCVYTRRQPSSRQSLPFQERSATDPRWSNITIPQTQSMMSSLHSSHRSLLLVLLDLLWQQIAYLGRKRERRLHSKQTHKYRCHSLRFVALEAQDLSLC